MAKPAVPRPGAGAGRLHPLALVAGMKRRLDQLELTILMCGICLLVLALIVVVAMQGLDWG
ncbi:hypothetical protein thsps117_01160 [Pseudomonas sp. No.117]